MKTIINSLFEKALSVVKSKLVLWLAIALVSAFGTIWYLTKQVSSLKSDNRRISNNFDQVTEKVKSLNLTIGEYEKLKIQDKSKIDSLLKVIDEKPKHLKSVTITTVVYKDTGSTKIIYQTPKKQPNSALFTIPVSGGDNCWGFKGNIISSDPKSKLDIKEKTANNSIQLVVIKKKKFLFWTIKQEQFRGFSDCGELNITQINFVK